MERTFVTELALRSSREISAVEAVEIKEWLLSIPCVDSVDILIQPDITPEAQADVLVISHQSSHLGASEADLRILEDARSSLFLHPDFQVVLNG